MKRREIKGIHEKSVLNAFESYCDSNGIHLKILSKPDPPDAIIELDGETGWIEITDAFFNSEHAESITSAISEDKEWKKSSGQSVDPSTFKRKIEDTIHKKLNKQSIKNICFTHGKGILILGCFSPFHFPVKALEDELGDYIKDVFLTNNNIFRSLYIYEYDYQIVKLV